MSFKTLHSVMLIDSFFAWLKCFLSIHYTFILRPIHFAFRRRWSCFFHPCEIWSRVYQSCVFHPRIFHVPRFPFPHRKSLISPSSLWHGICERRTVCANVVKLGLVLESGLGLVVAAAYRPLVLRTSFISYVLNADSGRYANSPIH